jgi:hypothetical protein
MQIQRPDGVESSLQELKADVEAAKKKFLYTDYSFSYVTVESLIDKIEELQARIDNGKGCRLVGDGALQLVRNALTRDAEKSPLRKEILDELDKATRIL